MNYAELARMPDGECLIYEIRSASGNSYVGSTVTPRRRIAFHFRSLSCGSHTSFLLQRAYDKYGRVGLSFSPVMVCDSCDRDFWESALIQRIGSYNLMKEAGVPPSGSMLGKVLSQSSREMISKAAMKRHEENRMDRYDPLCAAAWEMARSGVPRYIACMKAGVSRDTFYKWVSRNGLGRRDAK